MDAASLRLATMPYLEDRSWTRSDRPQRPDEAAGRRCRIGCNPPGQHGRSVPAAATIQASSAARAFLSCQSIGGSPARRYRFSVLLNICSPACATSLLIAEATSA
jgi:hypothetical protein